MQVSIIIATFNAGKTLANALNSVMNQSFQDWECIVVDGASTDNTMKIVKDFASKDIRFHYISEPDKGIYDAFNKGWKMAKGEWIYYLGADDRLTSDGLAQIMADIDDGYNIISGCVFIQKIDGTIKLQVSNGYEGCHQAKLMKRDLFFEYNGFDESYKILGDADLMIRLSNNNEPIKNYPYVIAYFGMGGTSQNFKRLKQKIQECLRVYKKSKRIKRPYFQCFKDVSYAFCSVIYRKLRKGIFPKMYLQ